MSAMRSMPADAGLLSLQQEALQRVRQMQQRARLAVEGRTGENTPPPSAQAAPAPGALFPAGGLVPAAGSRARSGVPSSAGSCAAESFHAGRGRAAFRPAAELSSSESSSLRGTETAAFLRRREYPLPAVRRHTAAVPQAGSGRPARPGKAERANGLLDLIRGGLGGGEAAGLGDSLRGSIASASKPLSDLLDAFSIDGEKLLILLVMWVIFNERSDNKTLLLATGISAAVMRAVPAVQRQRPPRTKAAGAFPGFCDLFLIESSIYVKLIANVKVKSGVFVCGVGIS